MCKEDVEGSKDPREHRAQGETYKTQERESASVAGSWLMCLDRYFHRGQVQSGSQKSRIFSFLL